MFDMEHDRSDASDTSTKSLSPDSGSGSSCDGAPNRAKDGLEEAPLNGRMVAF